MYVSTSILGSTELSLGRCIFGKTRVFCWATLTASIILWIGNALAEPLCMWVYLLLPQFCLCPCKLALSQKFYFFPTTKTAFENEGRSGAEIHSSKLTCEHCLELFSYFSKSKELALVLSQLLSQLTNLFWKWDTEVIQIRLAKKVELDKHVKL